MFFAFLALFLAPLLGLAQSPFEAPHSTHEPCSRLLSERVSSYSKLENAFIAVLAKLRAAISPHQWREVLETVARVETPINPLEQTHVATLAYSNQLTFLLEHSLEWSLIRHWAARSLQSLSLNETQSEEVKKRTARIPGPNVRPIFDIGSNVILSSSSEPEFEEAPNWVEVDGSPHLFFIDRNKSFFLFNLQTGERKEIFQGKESWKVGAYTSFTYRKHPYALFTVYSVAESGWEPLEDSGIYALDLLTSEIVQFWPEQRVSLREPIFRMTDTEDEKPRFLFQKDKLRMVETTFGETEVKNLEASDYKLSKIIKIYQFLPSPDGNYLLAKTEKRNTKKYTVFSYPEMQVISQFSSVFELDSRGLDQNVPTLYLDPQGTPRLLLGSNLHTQPSALESKEYDSSLRNQRVYQPPIIQFNGQRLSVSVKYSELQIIDLDKMVVISRISLPFNIYPGKSIHFLEIEGELFVFCLLKADRLGQSKGAYVHLSNAHNPTQQWYQELDIRTLDTLFSIAPSAFGPIAYSVSRNGEIISVYLTLKPSMDSLK